MPRTPHFQSTANWPMIRQLWLDWMHGNRPDIKNLQQVAKEGGTPYPTLCKKTARWKREEQAKLDKEREALDAKAACMLATKGPLPKPKTDKQHKDRLSADRPSNRETRNKYVDQYREARSTAKDAVNIAVQGLVEEIQQGSGASRVTAIRELLDRAGLSKETEKKDEASPYERDTPEVLFSRMETLFMEYEGWETFIRNAYRGLEKSKVEGEGSSDFEPHHLVHDPLLTSITSVPNIEEDMSGRPVVVDRSRSHNPLSPPPGCIEAGKREVGGMVIIKPLG